jgi:glycosyltransferase involved in cell wall biosynthesis
VNAIHYSFIIPVFNRPEEIEKLLVSLSQLVFERDFEVVIIEDGSDLSSEVICSRFLSYFKGGPFCTPFERGLTSYISSNTSITAF